MMSPMEIIAGDFLPGKIYLMKPFGGKKLLLVSKKVECKSWLDNGIVKEKVYTADIASVEIYGEEETKSFLKSAGLGIAGGFLLGPAGLIAGTLVGGRKKRVTFAVTLKDGRRILATAKEKVFIELKAAVF